jgi:uncharacterized membrane protein
MSRKCRSVVGRAAVLAAVAAASSLFAVTAPAAAGPPQGGGGCHMVSSPSFSGLDHMMAGAANGSGQTNMIEMLLRFYPDALFCGL